MIGRKENYDLTGGFKWIELLPHIGDGYEKFIGTDDAAYIIAFNAIKKLVEELFPFQFTIRGETLAKLNENSWCYNSIREGWTRRQNTFYFEEKSDAALFKLFWFDSDDIT